jgi:L-fuconolactonase
MGPLRIDSHQHFWQYDPARHSWIDDAMSALRRDFLPEHLHLVLQSENVDATIAVQVDQSEQETEYLLDLTPRYPFIAGIVGWIDLRAANLEQRLEHFGQFPKLRGFRHIAQSEPDDQFLIRDDFVRGLSLLRKLNFTYDILIYARQLPAAVALIDKLPDQPFVIDHIAKPEMKAHKIEAQKIKEWAAGIRVIAANPNVYCKISGLITEADWHNWKPDDFKPYLDIVFGSFGPDRIMFGSDWPVCLLAGSYSQVKALVDDYVRGWPESDRAKFFGGNASRFYRLAE